MKLTALRPVGKPDDAAQDTSVERSADGGVNITRIVYQAAPDELLPFPFGLEEESAARSLIRRGKLRAVKIGRRLYCRRSDLLRLVDVLSVEEPANDTPSEAYAALVSCSRRTR